MEETKKRGDNLETEKRNFSKEIFEIKKENRILTVHVKDYES